MITQPVYTLIAVLTAIQLCNASVMRNKALISKMVSRFQKDSYPSSEAEKVEQNEDENHQKPDRIISLMQNVLCRNFPTIPCRVIEQDETLKNLIQKSIQQLKYKTLKFEKTTSFPKYLTLFPTINEELTNFMESQVHDETAKHVESHKKKKQKKSAINFWPKEKYQKNPRENKRTVFNSGKKLRKFYPHKIKYKDKGKSRRVDYGDYTEEKLSMSVEVPDMTLTKRHQHMSYKLEAADPPVWRIDYTKHGEASYKTGFQDGLKGKTGPNVILDESPHIRKDVLHPDVYIKKNFVRKAPVDVNSDIIDN